MTLHPRETLVALGLARALAILADRVPAGPWKSWIEGRDHRSGGNVITTDGHMDLYVEVVPAEDTGEEDRRARANALQDYIAACNPQAIVTLGDELTRAVKRVEEANGIIADFEGITREMPEVLGERVRKWHEGW